MKWDYIIIGAGSAGCALAHELVIRRPHETVLLLEAGGSDRSPWLRFPAGSLHTRERTDWGYRSQPDSSRHGYTEPWARGRVLGGSSSVNSTVFVRGAARDFDRWSSLCDPAAAHGWSAEDVIPIYREMETSDRAGACRGHTGPLHIRTVNHPHPVTNAFIKSALACGHRFNEDYNGETQEGVAFTQLSQRRGIRCSSADAFVRPLLGGRQKNFCLLLNAWVQKIEFVKRRAVSVSFIRHRKLRMEAARHIIVCAGAINSPQLLMISGIGEAGELKRHNIDVLIDLPAVGRNLRDHPLTELVYRTRIPTYNPTGGLIQKLGFVATFLRSREGPISNLFEAVAFLRTSPSEPAPDIQLHFTAAGYLSEQDGASLVPYPSVSVFVNKNYPLSTGRIRLGSNDPSAPPLIEHRLLDDNRDVDSLVRGIGLVRKIMAAEPIASLVQEERAPGTRNLDEISLKDYLRSHTRITYHPSGTCRMGTDADSVVGPDLRVRGIENLWVADASIMPDLISGNTNAVCIMLGKKLGKQFVAEGSGASSR